jgi:hypothetical protein
MFGKWSQAGVPHTGWACVDMEDLGEPSETCEMCETAEVRYVHVMRNPAWGDLRVGCVCAARMEQDSKAAQERESGLKKYASRKRKAAEKEFQAGEELKQMAVERREERKKAAAGWINAADKILQSSGLSERERKFVSDVRSRFCLDHGYRISQWHIHRFKDIHSRIGGQ